MDFKKLYEENKDFKASVDRYCKSYGLPVDEALKHVLVQEIGKQYAAEAAEQAQRIN